MFICTDYMYGKHNLCCGNAVITMVFSYLSFVAKLDNRICFILKTMVTVVLKRTVLVILIMFNIVSLPLLS